MERRKTQLKTLIWNGSPRKNGDTAQLIRLVTEKLSGIDGIAEFFNR